MTFTICRPALLFHIDDDTEIEMVVVEAEHGPVRSRRQHGKSARRSTRRQLDRSETEKRYETVSKRHKATDPCRRMIEEKSAHIE